MTDFLVDDLALDYELLPGENQVLFTYKTIWAKSGVVENGESKVHVVETPMQAITLNASAGDAYRFDIEKPTSRRQAESMLDTYSVEVVDTAGRTVATSSRYVSPKASRSPVPDSTSVDTVPSSGSASTLQKLKSMWGQASEEEKREFLRWAFE